MKEKIVIFHGKAVLESVRDAHMEGYDAGEHAVNPYSHDDDMDDHASAWQKGNDAASNDAGHNF